MRSVKYILHNDDNEGHDDNDDDDTDDKKNAAETSVWAVVSYLSSNWNARTF